MKKLILCFTVIFISMNPCMGNDRSDIYQFANDYIKSLKLLKMIQEETSAFNRQYKNNILYANTTATFLSNTNRELLKAKNMISKYNDSENQMVKDAAKSILFIFDSLNDIQHETLKMFEELNSPEIIKNMDRFDIEGFSDKTSELQIKHDKFLDAFTDVSLLVTYALVSWIPDENGQLKYLTISQKEREALTRQLDNIFDSETEKGVKYVPTNIDSCGAVLRKVLTGGHISADER